MIEAKATARYVRTSAQKAGLVLDLIRGRDVNNALATLRYARKGVARDIEKVLRSAIANASQKEGFGGDVENLYVNACYANQGPSQKRIRPAPMGRAFRVVKRTAHLTVQVAEHPVHIAAPASPQPAGRSAAGGGGPERGGKGAPKRPRGAKPKPRAAAKKKTASKRSAGTAKKKTARKGGRAKTAKS